MQANFAGFGVVLQVLVTLGLVAIWNLRQRTKSHQSDTSEPESASPPAPQATIEDCSEPNIEPELASDAAITEVKAGAVVPKAIQQQVFNHLQTLLVNYPTATKAAQEKPDMPAKNITPMFAPLGNLLQDWGYEPIAQPWDEVKFNPQLHQPDMADIQPGETVYVRFIGYRNGDEIVIPAKVSRSLPQG